MSACRQVYHFGPDLNISTTIRWIGMNCITGINDPERMNPTYFGDPLT